jgi:hypothetical protein
VADCHPPQGLIDALLEPPDDIVYTWDPPFNRHGHLIFDVGVVMTSALRYGAPPSPFRPPLLIRVPTG